MNIETRLSECPKYLYNWLLLTSKRLVTRDETREWIGENCGMWKLNQITANVFFQNKLFLYKKNTRTSVQYII